MVGRHRWQAAVAARKWSGPGGSGRPGSVYVTWLKSSKLIPRAQPKKCHRQGDFSCARLAPAMSTKVPHDVSGLLTAWSQGDKDALKDLVSMVYPDMRRI